MTAEKVKRASVDTGIQIRGSSIRSGWSILRGNQCEVRLD